ncbi:MAG TPA: glycoside hydrolase family 2 TIM barrel-domain containing protein [Opitutaceae bacterium]|jgi:exo-1,4-beta-D-glucosaminidase|nr:glycoside hydrolase family 2 TIM barrel-domain containing protein [Opitutaceae bacterium]
MKKILRSFIGPRRAGNEAGLGTIRLSARGGLAAIFLIASLAARATDFKLAEGWALQSSAKIAAKGDVISTVSFKPDGWYSVTVPATVIAGLLQNHVYPDVFFGENLKLIDKEDFIPAWWYRREFKLAGSERGRRIWLRLEGLNYRADIWFNGRQLAEAKNMAGPFCAHEFDVTNLANDDGNNVLAVEIHKAVDINTDLTVDFVDWNPPPPDLNMGILNDVVVSTSGPVNLRHPLVTTKFDLPSLAVAHLTVLAEATNGSDQPLTGKVTGSIGRATFSQEVKFAPHETRQVVFTPEDYPQLNIAKPSIWWPWEYGQPSLQSLDLQVSVGGKSSDALTARFGIRQVTSELNADGVRIFAVNGKRIQIRGAAWTPNLFQQRTPQRQEQEIRYARDLNLNALRYEGKFEDEHMFELTDQYGILVITGWCCCDAWQANATWNDEQKAIARQSLRSLMYRLRNHPSMLAWLNGSDETPAPAVEKSYLDLERDLRWPNPALGSAAATLSEISGPSGMKMAGPYEWVPPIYWETDGGKLGGAWGFATEICPGPSIPPIESLARFIPRNELWPIGKAWLYHCGQNEFANLNIFTEALNHRYGASNSAEEYSAKAQLAAYEAHRAMFEAYGRHKYAAGGVIQWMMNNAWPSMIWHLYDYYLRPGGSYFAVKKALEPLHIQYSYADQAITVVNATLETHAGLTASVEIYNIDGSRKFEKSIPLKSVGPDAALDIFKLPAIADLSSVYFVRVSLADAAKRVISVGTYWLSKQPDIIAWEQKNPVFYYTPQAEFADYAALAMLPPAKVSVSERTDDEGVRRVHRITLKNEGRSIAFFIRLKLTKGSGGDEVLPVFWEDNYVTLFPGESREIKVSYTMADLGNAKPVITAEPYNNRSAHRE